MDVAIESCDHETFPALVSLLNREFIAGRNRRQSLSVRFPQLLCPENMPNLLVARCDGALCAALSLRVFRWLAGGRLWKGAMVGLVCTDPQYRGRGLGTTLMRCVHSRLRERAVDFGVLWTTIPDFYQREGWTSHDRGALGIAPGQRDAREECSLVPRPCREEDFAWLESVRARWQPQRVVRTFRDYCVIPPSCDRVHCFSCVSPREGEGYALVGERGDTGLVYELLGDPPALKSLWHAIRSRYCRVYVNERWESPTHAWLTAHGPIGWEPQSHTMWLGISADFQECDWSEWHIAYYDRI